MSAIATAQAEITSIGFPEVVPAFVAIATVQAAKGDAAGARETLSRVQDQGLDYAKRRGTWALLEIATARAALDDAAGAREIISRVLEFAHSLSDLTGKTWIMIDVAVALIKIGDEAQAKKTLKAASATLGTVGESKALPFMQAQMAELWSKAGDAAMALRVTQTIADAVLRDSLSPCSTASFRLKWRTRRRRRRPFALQTMRLSRAAARTIVPGI